MEKLTTFSKEHLAKLSFVLLFTCSLFSGQLFASENTILNLEVSLTTYNAGCGSANNGAITSVVSGGVPPYVYAWSNGETTPGIVDLAPGTYTLTVTDQAQNEVITSGTVGQDASDIELTMGASYETCAGSCDGNVSVNASGGTGFFTYQWNIPGEDFVVLDNACAGLYTVTVTDQVTGCSAVGSVELELSPEGIWLMTSGTDATCAGNDGTAHVSVMTGVAPFTIVWSDGQMGEDITDLSPGTYTVTVTDANGCSNTAEVTINGPTSIIITIDNVNDATCGEDNGSIGISVSGGTPNYTYLWSNGATTEDISDLGVGDYSVTVTDADGCTSVAGPISVNAPSSIVITVDDVNDATCGEENGSIGISVSGGTPAYSYIWSNGATTEDISGLGVGDYFVTITDAAGCTAVAGPITINEASSIVITVDDVNDATCGEENGSIGISVSGGTPAYSYIWSNGATTEDISGLGVGDYFVTVTDAAGCTAVAGPITINAPSSIVITVDDVIDATCGESNGSIGISVSGGTPAYNYLWSNGATTEDISDLDSGDYFVTVTDAAGCTAVAGPITINTDSPIMITVDDVNDATCGEDNGSIGISVSGGTPAYNFLWSNGATTEDILNLGEGDYFVTVTDAAGCTEVAGPITINTDSPIVITVDNINDASCGLEDGSIGISVSGGTPGYTYLWSNGATTEDIDNVGPGPYSVTVTDANNCTAVEGPITVGEDDCCEIPVVASVVVIETPCGLAEGIATINMVGNNADYTYDWNPDIGTENAIGNSRSNLPTGSYSVTITGDPNCPSIIENFTLGTTNGPIATVVNSTPATCNQANGSVEMSNQNYNYTWCNGATGYNPMDLEAGSCEVTITDPVTGCTDTRTVVIGEINPLVVGYTINNEPDCGLANGSVTINPTGGTSYEYLWSNGTNNSNG